jgi:hypothetical protein
MAPLKGTAWRPAIDAQASVLHERWPCEKVRRHAIRCTGPAMPTSKTFVWKDPRAMTLAVIIAMSIDIVCAMVGIATIVSGVHVDPSAPAGVNSGPALVLLLNGLLSLVVLANGILRTLWILRVSRNAHVLKGGNLANSPMFAAVWWYLVPFMSLFKPWESLSEIWDVSALDRDGRRSLKSILGSWWMLFLISSTLSYIGDFSHADVINLAALLLSVFEYGGFIIVAKTIREMQLEKKLGPTSSDEPGRLFGGLEPLGV